MLTDDIAAARERDEGIEDAVYEEEALTGADMARMEFARVRFIRCRFEDCDMTRAGFYDCALENCDISRCRIGEGYWRRCALNGVTGVNSDLHGSVMRELELTGCTLRYANLAQSKLEDVRLVS